ncbi:spore germination protein [Halalkalibacillus sediminis]|uniref:Spore germination protein n=1 Tax=Halalkalibacillus sediminis TaxID=2018042 RepID=A0A2I0QUS1_9BACI|nr:spore germination protein [Halalkalibacillus sediminis]PKR78095.1 spore germination protein [Halalkalibacillus sediminis]
MKNNTMIQDLRKLFHNCQDVIFEERSFCENKYKVTLVYTEGLSDQKLLSEDILPSLGKLFKSYNDRWKKDTLIENWHKSSITIEEKNDVMMEKVFSGELLICLEFLGVIYSLNIADLPRRKPEETNAEVAIRGPRDGFIEEIETNVALVRKRLKTNTLLYEKFTVGERAKTKVGLMYIEDIARPEIISDIRRRIENLKVDAITNTNELEELLEESSLRLFPMFHYTGRTDLTVDALLRGRFILFLDGAPIAVIGPVNLMLLLKTGEDQEYIWLYNSFERFIRLFGLIIGIALPGFWLALAGFHQDQLPLVLLSSLTQARQGVPLPTSLEIIILVLLFDLFREAGLRLPLAVGQILAVVGGLIIGDAAIRAGLTSPSTIVIIATSTVASFTIANQSLTGVISVMRLFVALGASLAGMFGFLVTGFLVLIYVSNLRSFSLPYLAPVAPINFKDWFKAVFRPSQKAVKTRPAILQVTDEDDQVRGK